MSSSAQDKNANNESIFQMDKERDFPEWFSEICRVAELADIRYGVKGFTPFMPWSVMTMNIMFDLLERVLQRKGHLPMIFPTLIPESNLKRESEHVAGFTPQVFWVTEIGDGEKIEERLALRPTSETAIYPMYSLWVRSWRDLPLKLYQRCSVFRSEIKSTRPFLRGREFLWIEAHNVFATAEEARAQVIEDLETTKEVVTGEYGIPVMVFRRTQWDKFPGGVDTFAADTLMPDGKVIQLPSTHNLGDNFAHAFDIKYLTENNETVYAYQTCYGPAISRIFGAMIAIHGDNKGLRLPYSLAPYQVVIVPIYKSQNMDEIVKASQKLERRLERAGIRVHTDLRDATPGWKYNWWEMKGVPIRAEIGQREVNEGKVVLFRRDLMQRETVSLDAVVKRIKALGLEINNTLRTEAEKKFLGLIVDAHSISEIQDALERSKIARIQFCTTELEGKPCGDEIKDMTGGEIRGTRIDVVDKPEGVCIVCGRPADAVVYVARSY